jgi:hypothetical protein
VAELLVATTANCNTTTTAVLQVPHLLDTQHGQQAQAALSL